MQARSTACRNTFVERQQRVVHVQHAIVVVLPWHAVQSEQMHRSGQRNAAEGGRGYPGVVRAETEHGRATHIVDKSWVVDGI